MKWQKISWIAQILKYFKQLWIPVFCLPFENGGLPTADYKPFPFGKFLLDYEANGEREVIMGNVRPSTHHSG